MNKSQHIALFGGTFDPFHEGHRMIATKACEQVGLDTVCFLPCHTSPHKLSSHSAPTVDRLAMLRLATQDDAHFVVDDFDARQAPPSYSYLTVEHFAACYPSAQLYWIMGFDQWQALPRWKNPEMIAQHVIFLVFARGAMPEPREGYRMKVLSGTHPASASALRDPASADYLRSDWLHPRVIDYIKKNHLYC